MRTYPGLENRNTKSYRPDDFRKYKKTSERRIEEWEDLVSKFKNRLRNSRYITDTQVESQDGVRKNRWGERESGDVLRDDQNDRGVVTGRENLRLKSKSRRRGKRSHFICLRLITDVRDSNEEKTYKEEGSRNQRSHREVTVL